MAQKSPLETWRLSMPAEMGQRLMRHLFPGDNDEHGAIILAGVCWSDRGLRLVARELHLATDGSDYVSGKYGYRMLRAEFIRDKILKARDLKLAYLAIHNHGGTTSVEFSSDDLDSHERGYPALLDIARGMPVGALVFARGAVAGDLWLPDQRRLKLESAALIGNQRTLLYPQPRKRPIKDITYDRQSRLFGDVGQAMLAASRVGIIGLGGAGSVLAELLGRLGVGEFILVDPDKAEITNLPRLIGARHVDAVMPSWIPARLRNYLRQYKVDMAARNIKQANAKAKITALPADFLDQEVAKRFIDCDYLFLAADSMGARLAFNAIVHQYGIAGTQVGAKVPVDKAGDIGDVFCVSRALWPGHGCLWCNGLINPARLQDEAVPNSIKKGYAYLNDGEVTVPSVVTLNAVACAHAADDFLFHMMGLKDAAAETGWLRWRSRRNQMNYDAPRNDANCGECSAENHSRLGRGDNFDLPVKRG